MRPERRVEAGSGRGRAPAGGARRTAANPVLGLQRTIGNRAVSLLVQRQDAGTFTPAQTLEAVQARHAAVSAAAKAAATEAWKQKERHEVGGIIYQLGRKYGSTGPRTSGDGMAVDVGQRLANAGAPEGAMPVGYWHTHPNDTDPLTGAPRTKRTGVAAFSEGDLIVAKDYQLDPFVIDMFGYHEVDPSVWYDPTVFTSWRPFKR